MIGHKFGEFVYTRKFLGHKKQNKKLVFKKKLPIIESAFKSFRTPVEFLYLSEKIKFNEKTNKSRII